MNRPWIYLALGALICPLSSFSIEPKAASDQNLVNRLDPAQIETELSALSPAVEQCDSSGNKLRSKRKRSELVSAPLTSKRRSRSSQKVYSYQHSKGTAQFAEFEVPADGFCARHALGIKNDEMIAKLSRAVDLNDENVLKLLAVPARTALGLKYQHRDLTQAEYKKYIEKFLSKEWLSHDVVSLYPSASGADISTEGASLQPIQPEGTLGAVLEAYAMNARVWQPDAHNPASLVLVAIYTNSKNPEAPFVDMLHTQKLNLKGKKLSTNLVGRGVHYNLLVDTQDEAKIQDAERRQFEWKK